MMTFISFDARVRADRLIGFYVPTNVPSASASFTVTITGPGTPDAPGPLYAIVSFACAIPADRHVVFTCPPSVPLGIAHFLVLITTASTTAAIYQLKVQRPRKSKPKSRRRPRRKA
jgi:hypothetical protein